VTAQVVYEPRRNLARSLVDPLTGRIDREFFGAAGAADGRRNLASFTDKGSVKGGGAVTRNTTSYEYLGPSPIEGGDPIVSDNLRSLTRPGAPPISYTYTPTLNRVESVTDAREKTTNYEYTTAGNLEKILYPATEDLRATVSGATLTTTPQTGRASESFTYEPRGRVQTHTGANEGITTFEYEDAATGLVTSIKRPEHAKPEKFGYDVLGNTKRHEMPEGGVTKFELDDLYRVQRQIEPPGDVAEPATRFEYSLDSEVVAVTDPRTFVTRHGYDRLGRLRVTTNAQRDRMFFFPDREGNTRATKDFRGFVTTSKPDALGRVVRQVRPGPPAMATTTEFDPNGNVKSTTEEGPTARTTKHFYDGRNNPVRTEHPQAGLVDETEVDFNDTVVQSIRREGGAFKHGTRSLPDARNRVTRTTELTADPALGPVQGHETQVFFDRENNRTRVVDADGKRTTMAHDRAGRQVATADGADGVVSRVEYTENDLRARLYVQPPA